MAEIPELLVTAFADRYRIERQIGEGGMAKVYLAEDLKHDRKVALKVLRSELAAVLGAERFVREIKTTAKLQHPHILPLYDSGSATAPGSNESFLFYVMPYIEGESLRQRLDREQQLRIDDAVRIGVEVADALQYAHEQGVIHRDIKPDNILLRNGRAIVADFGIALAIKTAAGSRMTETGLSLGTPHYMSPEQATAERTITHRSDIFSLGAVLYELLTGEPPHTGASAQLIVMKLVSETARPVGATRRAVPRNVEAAVAMALEKIPADRFDSAKAFADALRNPAFATHDVTAKSNPMSGVGTQRAVLPALLMLVLLIGSIVAWNCTRPNRLSPVARFPTILDVDGKLDGMALGIEVALSPDGSTLVFRSPLTGPGQLYSKRRDEVMARPLVGTEGGSGPFFSPDGAWIGFVADGQLRRIPSTGGASLKLADSVDAVYNRGAWLDDGSIVFYDSPTRSLRRLRSGEARAETVVTPSMLEGRFPWLPAPLPASRGFLFTAHHTNCVGVVSCRPSRVYVYELRRDTIRDLFDDAIGAWHVRTGHVLYLTSSGTLMAVQWDNSALAPIGRPVPILDGVQAPGFQISVEGTAYYVLGQSEFAPGPLPNATVVWVDRSGRVEPVDSSWQVNTGGAYRDAMEVEWGLALSPDGRRIALTQFTDLGTDIWIKHLPAGPTSRLTLDPGIDRSPSWTRDGRAVTFLSNRALSKAGSAPSNTFNVWEQAADGIGEPRLIWASDSLSDAFTSPDGRWIILGTSAVAGTSTQRDIFAASPGVDSVPRRVAATAFDESGAALSSDSRWLAYVSNEQGVSEVFVRPFPNVSGGKWQVSSGGGSAPIWANNGRELFYVVNRAMYVVRINPGPPFSTEPPRMLFRIPPDVRAGSLERGTIAISNDDQRFLMVRDNSWADMAGTSTLIVVQNFLEELRAKLKR